MKLIILFFAFYQSLLGNENPTDKRSIAVLIRTDFRGEISFANRIQAACKNLSWKADILDIDEFLHLKKHNYDFVINLVPGSYKSTQGKSYLAIFHPTHHYFHPDGRLKKKYNHYDGYLLTYAPGIHDRNFSHQQFPYLQWYPTAEELEYKKVDPLHLFHICCSWGNRFDDVKFQQFLTLLDAEPYTRFYGDRLFQKLYPKSYQSNIPFNSKSLYEIASSDGVVLILHSAEHNAHGIPSGKIFEAAAASTVIICDDNAFARESFGDSLLYINTNESAESIYNQVKDHMNWIFLNKESALEKAKKAHQIYKTHFLLETQLLALNKLHNNLSKNPCWTWVKKMGSKCLSWIQHISAVSWLAWSPPLQALIHPEPLAVLKNIDCKYSLINSVDFHPQKNLFCATYTHNNKILFYEINKEHRPLCVQTLSNPLAQLSDPQHAVFSRDGEKLIVANWTNQTFNIYLRTKDMLYSNTPAAIIHSPKALQNCKPHGIAFSPCGNYFAVAYGAANYFEHGIALFQHVGTQLNCISFLKNTDLPGIPKGITFSPDGTHLLVTFSELNIIGIFPIENHVIQPVPKQLFGGQNTYISRPEDIKISPNGLYVAITNSNQGTVTFYLFDQTTNFIPQNTPHATLGKTGTPLTFPHGIAFSEDGSYIAVTQFGSVHSNAEGDIIWGPEKKSDKAKINLYLIEEKNSLAK